MTIVTFDTSADAAEALRADALCKTIGRALVQHYPHRQWFVDVTLKGGAVKVMCPSITVQFGYVIHLRGKTDHDIEKAAVKAGGQILEMFKLSRERNASGGEEHLQRNARGDAIHAATGL